MSSIQTAPIVATPCPECGATVSFGRAPLVAEVVTCDGCSAELEVLFTNPLRLGLAPEVEEDWGE